MPKPKSYAVVWLMHRGATVSKDLNALVLLILFPDVIITTFTMAKCSGLYTLGNFTRSSISVQAVTSHLSQEATCMDKIHK